MPLWFLSLSDEEKTALFNASKLTMFLAKEGQTPHAEAGLIMTLASYLMKWESGFMSQPIWNDASRPPEDTWLRPILYEPVEGVLSRTNAYYEDGAWWVDDVLGKSQPIRALYWLEIYPLPDGTGPQDTR
jgi:hypothetical protein